MRFNSYFVELKHSETNFTGNLMYQGKPVYANFKKLEDNLFVAYFKQQVAFRFLEELEFKNRKKKIQVLFPVLSKYNKRRLTRIAAFFSELKSKEAYPILFYFLSAERILEIGDLLYFFSLERDEVIKLFLDLELEKKAKLINVHNLSVVSYDHFLEYYEELHTIFSEHFVNRMKVATLTEIESNLKIPHTSVFFKYLVARMSDSFSFKIVRDKIIFQKLALSEKEKEAIDKIEQVLKAHKLPLFTVDNLLKLSDMTYKDINDALWSLLENEAIVQLNDKYFIFNEDLLKIINKMKKYKRNQGEMIDINAFRELTYYPRKYIIALFEYLDTQKITMRVENRRKILLPV